MVQSIFYPKIRPGGEHTLPLLLRIEEEFGIDMPDSDLESVVTVKDLYELVLSKLETPPSTRPSRAFYQLRRAMIACLGLERKSVRPSTKLAILLPKPTRIAAWKSLAEVSGLEFPKLRHPRWARDVIRILAVLTSIGFLIGMMGWTHPSGALWVPLFLATAAVGVFALTALCAATPFLAREFPTRTIGELAKMLFGMNPDEFESDDDGKGLLSRQDVWLRLVQIFCDQCNLDWEQIKPEARLSEDIRLD